MQASSHASSRLDQTPTNASWLKRGESSVAAFGLVATVILAAALMACSLWLMRTPGVETFWKVQAPLVLIAAASLGAMLLAYRHFHHRMQTAALIRKALLDAHRGETSESALRVSGDLGAEAQMWNRMLAEQQRLRRLAAAQEVRQVMGVADAGRGGDLASGCDAMPHGLLMIDEQLRVCYANNAAALFLHIDRDNLLHEPIDQWLDRPELVAAVRQAVEHTRRVTHLVDRRESGGTGVLRISIRPMRRNDAAVAMLVIEDVTQQRVAEEARHEFVAHATHELRTPLTNIRLYLETMLEEGESDAALRAKCLNVINQETYRLERMVGDLLSVAEIEAGSLQMNRDDVRMDELIREIQGDYEAQAAEKSVQLAFELPPKMPVIQGDRDKLMMAVQNVVANALKYTPENGRVTVTTQVGDGLISIDVADTGIGIAPEDADRIFDKFYRAADKRVGRITGSGLGLALAREVVRLHGGDITLVSQLDQGSTFTITVPVGEGG